MKRSLFFIFLLMVIMLATPTTSAYANNLSVTNVSLSKAPGQPTGTIDVKFDVSWDNPYSGVDANGAQFFDRAWVFVKYWNSSWTAGDTAWGHATLTAAGALGSGTVGAYSAVTGTGLSADNKGAFCRIGKNQTVRWNFGATGGDGLNAADTFTVKVFAIEMVYIPTGPFEIGDGNGTAESTNAFHVTDNTKAGTIGTTLLGSVKVDVNSYDDDQIEFCLLYTSPSPRDRTRSRMPSSA